MVRTMQCARGDPYGNRDSKHYHDIIEMRKDDVRRRFLEAMDLLDNPGSFCAVGQCAATQPQLHVPGVRKVITWPLTQVQAREIIGSSAAERAPHGHGEQTLVDPNVRDAWRVPPAALRFDNPAWQQSVDEAAAAASAALGLQPGAFIAKLYNLLVYEQGGKFVAHRDSVKERGMIGTLVITLPSKHSGGALVVRHGGETKRFNSEGSSGLLAPEWCAFYADCEHELEPITEGFRAVLIYNLVQRQHNPQTQLQGPPTQQAAADALSKLVADWVAVPHEPPKLVYFLEHLYPGDQLDFGTLKGADAAAAQALKRCGQVDMALVAVELTEHSDSEGGDCEDETIECRGWEPAPWQDTSPAVLAAVQNSGTSSTEYAQGDWYFCEEDADESEHEGWTGNEGSPITRWYRRTAIVLWPKAHRIAIADVDGALSQLQKALEGREGALCGYEDAGAMQAAILKHHTGTWSAEQLAAMLGAVARLPLKAFKAYMKFVTSELRLQAANAKQLVAPLLAVVRAHGCSAVEDALNKAFTAMARASERGAGVAWELLEGLQTAAEPAQATVLNDAPGPSAGPSNSLPLVPSLPGGPALLAALATALVPLLTLEFPPAPLPGWRPYSSRAGPRPPDPREKEAAERCHTLLHAWRALSSLDKPKLMEDAARNIRVNSTRFASITVIAPVIVELTQGDVIPASASALVKMLLQTLKKLVAVAPDAYVSPAALASVFRVLEHRDVVSDHVSSVLARPQQFPPLTDVLPAITALLEDVPAALENPAWARAILSAVAAAPDEDAAATKAKALEQAFVALARFVGVTGSAEGPAPSNAGASSSKTPAPGSRASKAPKAPKAPKASSKETRPWCEQLVASVIAHPQKWPPLQVCLPAALALSDVPAAKSVPAFLSLLNHTIKKVRPEVTRQLPHLRDWAITSTRLPCKCPECKAVEQFLKSPVQESITFKGPFATPRGHLTLTVQAAAAIPGSGFSAEAASNRRVNGELTITKDAAGRTPVTKLQERSLTENRIKRVTKELQRLEKVKHEIEGVGPSSAAQGRDDASEDAAPAAAERGESSGRGNVRRAGKRAAPSGVQASERPLGAKRTRSAGAAAE